MLFSNTRVFSYLLASERRRFSDIYKPLNSITKRLLGISKHKFNGELSIFPSKLLLKLNSLL